MPTKVVHESRRLHGAGEGNGGNGHGDRDRVSSAQKAGDGKVLLVSQEIMRLVDASREGRLTERGRADQFDGVLSRNRAGHQRNAGRHPAADRGGQPHPGPDFQRQDRRTDRPDLQGRPREDEAGGQQRRRRACRACRRNWRA